VKPAQLEVAFDRAWNERQLVKLLLDLWRARGVQEPDKEVADRAERIKARLLQIKMQAYEGCSPLERDLWQALCEAELRHSEQCGRRFEDNNFRRRIAVLGIINATIENVLLFRTRASSRLKSVSMEAIVLKHNAAFGSHLCYVARQNCELRSLLSDARNESDE
jgi:hypothetical protein